jgi:hypothetical protein
MNRHDEMNDYYISVPDWDNYIYRKWRDGPRGNKKPITDLYRYNQFKGKKCFILAGGPSLIGFDFSQLRGQFTIGINRVCEIYWPTLIYLADPSILLNRVKNFRKNSNIIILDLINGDYDDCYYVLSSGEHGYPHTLAHIYGGILSSYGALNLAIALGFSDINLLGYDFQYQDGKSHFLPSWTAPRNYENYGLVRGKRELEDFSLLAAGKVKIFNLNPGSALKAFPFKNINEALRD